MDLAKFTIRRERKVKHVWINTYFSIKHAIY